MPTPYGNKVGTRTHSPWLARYQHPGMRQEGVSEPFRYVPGGRYDFFDDADDDAGITNAPESPYTTAAGGSPTAGVLKAARNGQYQLALDATNAAQTAGYYRKDYTIVPATDFRFRCRFQIPTAITTAQKVVIGMAGAYNDTLASITRYVWGYLNASMVLVIQAYDGTTLSTVTSSVTLAAATWYELLIDAGNLNAIQFYLGDAYGAQPAHLGTVAGLLFAVTDLLQPLVILQKASGTGAPTLLWDYVGFSSPRL